MKTQTQLLDELIRLALDEDIGDGDASTLCCIPPAAEGTSQLLIKEHGIIAGVNIAARIFRTFDPALTLNIHIPDGNTVNKGDIAFSLTGKIRSILQTERLVLNIMQRMSGIATNTRRYVQALEGTNTQLLDTRKTSPASRILEKEAVRIGGGCNHRFGLFDMILLKDNHIDFAGGIQPAINAAQRYLKQTGKSLKIEIEVRNLNELEQALQTGGIHRILLDNFSISNLRKAVQRINGLYPTEASGNITLRNIKAYAQTGVNFISVGALTHSLQSLDMSLKAS